MKLIAGLGNPGVRYANTRHNAGFMVLDKLAEMADTSITKEKFEGKYAKLKIKGEDVILLKPETYMNNSGFCVKAFMDYFRIPAEDLLLIYDDKDLDVGEIRLRQKGGAGGHNGVKSVIALILGENFDRIRVGIGKPDIRIIDFVLSKFKEEEKEALEEGITQAAKAAWFAIDHDFTAVMNRYNKKKPKVKKEKLLKAQPGVQTITLEQEARISNASADAPFAEEVVFLDEQLQTEK